MICLLYYPPYIIIFFINNVHVYFQFCNICRCFLVALIIFCNSKWLFMTVNGILKLFSWGIFRMENFFFINLIRIFMCFLIYVLSINMLFNLVIFLDLFCGVIFRLDTCFFIKLIRIFTCFFHYVISINRLFSFFIDI